jgi:hypothetical protein
LTIVEAKPVDALQMGQEKPLSRYSAELHVGSSTPAYCVVSQLLALSALRKNNLFCKRLSSFCCIGIAAAVQAWGYSTRPNDNQTSL